MATQQLKAVAGVKRVAFWLRPAAARGPWRSICAAPKMGDEIVELEGELRVAKTSLAVALGEKEEAAHALAQTRKSLMAAIQQLTLVQQVRGLAFHNATRLLVLPTATHFA